MDDDPLVWLRENAREDAELLTKITAIATEPLQECFAAKRRLAARLRALLESQASQAAEIARLREALDWYVQRDEGRGR